MLAPLARGRSAVRAVPWPTGWLTRYWPALCALPALAALIALAVSSAPDAQLLLPLLAIAPGPSQASVRATPLAGPWPTGP